MGVAFVCDKCEKVFSDKKNLKRVVCAGITTTNRLMNKYDISIDLCSNCCSELFDFFKKEESEDE